MSHRLCSFRIAPIFTWLVALFCCACTTPRQADAQTALFSDLDAGYHVAGIPLAEWEGAPSESEFRIRPVSRNVGVYREEPGELFLDDIRDGDFQSLRLVHAPIRRFVMTSDGGFYEELDAVVGVIAKPRWSEPGSDSNSALLEEGEVAAPPRPEGVAAQLARFGLALGKLHALSPKYGLIFGTAAPDGTQNWSYFAALEPGAAGKGPQLAFIIRYLEFGMFEHIECDLVPRIEEYARARARVGSLDCFLAYKQSALDAVRVGVEEPAAIFARLEQEAAAVVSPSLKVVAERFEAADLKQRLLMTQQLAIDAENAADIACEVPPAAANTLRSCLGLIVDQLDKLSSKERESHRELEAEAYAMMVRLLRELRSLEPSPPDIPITGPNLVGTPESLAACVWVLEKTSSFEGKNLLERLTLHRELCTDTTRPTLVSSSFLELESSALAEEFEAAARVAAEKDLHATACARFLIAVGLRSRGVASIESSTLMDARERLMDTDAAARRIRSEMESEGLILAARFVPLIEAERVGIDASAAAYDSGGLLAGTPFSAPDRLGLRTGSYAQQHAFAAGRGAPILKFAITPPDILELTSTTRTESVPKTLYTSKVVSNDPAVLAWEMERDRLSQAIMGFLSGPINEVNNEAVLKYGTGRRPHETKQEFESRLKKELEQAYPKAGSNGSASLERLEAELKAHNQRRPPETDLQITSNLVHYRREVQEWKYRFSRDVELTGDAQSYKFTGTTGTTFECYYVEADARTEVEGVDGRRTEEQVRADTQLFESPSINSDFASFGLALCLQQRIDEYDVELGTRGLSELEVMTEQRWMRYFFSALEDAALDSAASRQNEVIEMAFTRFE